MVDDQPQSSGHIGTRSYYQEWYAKNDPHASTNYTLWNRYAQQLHSLIASLPMPNPRGLEIGSGGGLLQWALERYIGIDVASSASRFVTRPFCTASALALPFADETFDIVWSLWTLEHIIDPEGMLQEMLRVLKSGGYCFLVVGWAVPDWAPRGYHKGQWHELNQRNPLAAAILRWSVYPRRWLGWPFLYLLRTYQLLRDSGETLSYRLFRPNYESYHEIDADACIWIDMASVILWFGRRGMSCISHPTWRHILFARHDAPLIFRKHAQSNPRAS